MLKNLNPWNVPLMIQLKTENFDIFKGALEQCFHEFFFFFFFFFEFMRKFQLKINFGRLLLKCNFDSGLCLFTSIPDIYQPAKSRQLPILGQFLLQYCLNLPNIFA